MKRKYSHVESLNESLWTIPDDYFKGSIFPKDYFKPFFDVENWKFVSYFDTKGRFSSSTKLKDLQARRIDCLEIVDHIIDHLSRDSSHGDQKKRQMFYTKKRDIIKNLAKLNELISAHDPAKKKIDLQ